MSAKLVISDLIQLNVNSTRPSGSMFYYDGSIYRHSSIATIIGSTLSVTGLGVFTGSLAASSLKIGSTLVIDNSLVLLNITVPASTLSTGIAVNKLIAQTASKALVSDASGFLTASSVTSTELSYMSGVTSSIQTQLGNTQPLDSTLTSLAAYNTNGIITQTAADTFTGRTLTGTTNQVSISNGNGVSGNPTFSLPQSIDTGATVTFNQITGSTKITTPSVTNAGTLALSATSTNVITLSTNSSEALRVDSNGYVGIGASPNVSILELNKATSATMVTARGTAIAIRGNTYTDTGTSTISIGTSFSISAPVFTSASTGSIYTDASTLYISGPPTAAGSASITRAWGIDCRGAVRIGSTQLSAGYNYMMTVYKSSTATSSTDIAFGLLEASNPSGTNSGTVIAFDINSGTSSSCAQNITNTIGIQASISHRGSGTITSAAAIKVDTATRSGAGTVTTAYGLWIRQQSVTGITTGIAIYQENSSDTSRFVGNVSIGKSAVPGYALDVVGVINVAGTTSNTYRWNAATTAPSTTVGVVTTNRYGGNTNILGDPIGWLLCNVAGTDIKIPYYT